MKISKKQKRKEHWWIRKYGKIEKEAIKNALDAKRGDKPKRKLARVKMPIDGFYETEAWRMLRYKVLVHYGKRCMCCGTTDGEFHVDHIKPRSKYPDLELVFDNLQILCRDCNFGKSNTDETDFRKNR